MEPKYKPNDPELIENILAEVKRSGMFDQFRKDCISDVDTKPAYQNLQFKVENTVTKFLGSQKWSPDTNRNQLREKLRKNILDTGYLDTGIERIVDQVLYPKMAGFQSQIEELVYSYLKIDRPKRKVVKEEVDETEDASSLLPKDLEAVSSPESEKHKSFSQHEENDDFESPAFELLEGVVVETEKQNDDSHLSGLSNMTSEGSVTAENKQKEQPLLFESMDSLKQEDDESKLSQVSSGSRLSIVVQSEKDSSSPKPEVLNITEEAQMPKFSENSNSIDAKTPGKEAVEGQSVFDFKREEIEFKGPSRKQMTLNEKLKEEIYESENKHANLFKTDDDDDEPNSESSEMRLEIVEQNITESESGMKIDVEGSGNTENEAKGSEKPAPMELPKKEKSSHHKSSKSSKHKERDREERHKSKHKSRHSSSSKSSSKHRKSRSEHKSSRSDEKRSEVPSLEGKPIEKPSKESMEGIVEDISERDDAQVLSSEAFYEPNPLEEYNESPLNPSEMSPVKKLKDSPPKLTSLESTPNFKHASSSPHPPMLDFISDEDDFYGFPEDETDEILVTSTPQSEFLTPSKISSSQKSILNQSIQDEDSFYGFDDSTPVKKPEESTSVAMQSKNDEKSEDKSTGDGKRVRRPNAKYVNDEFTTNDAENEEEELLPKASTSTSKKRKRVEGTGKVMKKAKSEEKDGISETNRKEIKTPTPEDPENSKEKSSKSSKKHSSGNRTSSRHK